MEDRRQLGIMLHGLTLRVTNGKMHIPLDHPMLTDGWWTVESDGATAWRWSNGDAGLALPEGCIQVELDLATPMPYVVPAASGLARHAA